MGRKKSYVTVTDQFCGAGGSSQGVRNVSNSIKGGLEVKLALNHWKLAIETHNTNFPDTIHDCTDISASDPRRYPSTDILITSPECTNHSLAKGVKSAKAQMDMFENGALDAAAERSRATMWDVPRFAEYHKYNLIIVENVVDARKWVMFEAWIHAMNLLGYNHQCVYLNSMFCYPTPQSRDRMYVYFWKKGNKAPDLNFMPLAWCPCCEQNVNAIQSWKRPDVNWGKYKQQYLYRCPKDGIVVDPYYYAAFNCIDWSDPGKRIGDRKKPLSPNTTKRIKYGLDKYGREPLILHSAYSEHARGVVRDLKSPAFTQTTLSSQAIANPFIINDQQSTGINFRVKSVEDKLPGITTAARLKLVLPFIIKGEHAMQDGYVKSLQETIQTQSTRQSMALVTPWIIEMNKTGECKPAKNPASTITSGGINHAMLTAPFLVENKGMSKAKSIMDPAGCATTKDYLGLITSESFNSFLSYYYSGSMQASGALEPTLGVTTNDRIGVVNYNEPNIEDCYYRMLKPHEIKSAMAFDKDYVVCGSGKDQVKQLGNAVTPPAMEWLVGQGIKTLM